MFILAGCIQRSCYCRRKEEFKAAKEAPGGWWIVEEFKGVGLIFENMEKNDSVRGEKTKERRRINEKWRIWRRRRFRQDKILSKIKQDL